VYKTLQAQGDSRETFKSLFGHDFPI